MYAALRPGKHPFPWMGRLFERITSGEPPLLADLPTGAGKTDIAVVWLIALAFYGAEGASKCTPVPRRLIWVVNRRVLVGQIYRLATSLRALIESPESSDLRGGLARLTADDDVPFRVVQLRGQVVDDREWSFNPSCPTLIIGTVDQIGSRLLFQGYGLGKRERPMHAGLFGVDSWICVDEAHLVPAFVLALRQLRDHIAKPVQGGVPAALTELFGCLPWWTTELSATPGLPTPAPQAVLALEAADEADTVLSLRILAAGAKRAQLIPCDEKSLVEKILARALQFSEQRKRVAIYVRKPVDARNISKRLASELRDSTDSRTLCITGRLRGVDRERLTTQPVFAVMSTDHRAANSATLGEPEATVYLVGTSAAEVGLDTDADAVLCDFATIDTLLQRLGRLDRLGAVAAAGKTAVMEVFTPPIGNNMLPQALQISHKLAREPAIPSAELMTGHYWSAVDHREVNRQVTYHIAERQAAPSRWRHEELAPASVPPVLVQPLIPELWEFWAATSIRPSRELPIHPWLYGYELTDESTPLVGIIFRYELDHVEHGRRAAAVASEYGLDEERDDGDTVEGDSSGVPTPFDKACREVGDLLDRHPPAKTEAHWVPLRLVWEWLCGHLDDGPERSAPPPKLIAWRTEDRWEFPTAQDGDDLTTVAAGLRAENFILLPTCAEVPKKISDELSTSHDFNAQADVADHAWGSDPQPGSPWLRRCDGSSAAPAPGFELCNEIEAELPTGTITLRYFAKPSARGGRGMFLSDHHKAAARFARNCLSALAGTSSPLAHFFESMAAVHDSGKDDPRWQRPAGNHDGPALAKYARPVPPAAFHGYRHEWASRTHQATAAVWDSLTADLPAAQASFFQTLFLHVIGSHHGHLRPSLPSQPHVQPAALQSAIQQAARDWHGLQHSLGPWRLAYLEALLKAADTLASRDGTEITHVDQL